MDTGKKIYISIAVFGAIGLVLAIFVIYPLCQNIIGDSGKLISQKGELAFAKKEIENTQNILSFYENHQSDLEKIDKVFLDAGNPIDFINFLNENAKTSQLEIEILSLSSSASFSPGKKEGATWSGLDFQVSVTGSFSGFSRFITRLENGPYLIEFLNLSVEKLSKEKINLAELQSSGVNAIFLIRAYAK